MLRFHGWPLLVAGGVLLLGSELKGQEPATAKEKPARSDATGEPLPDAAITRLRPERVRPGDQVVAVVFSPDGKLLASSSQDRVIRIWDVAATKELRQLKGHHGIIWRLHFSLDGKTLFSSGDDSTIRQWDVDSGRLAATFLGHQGAIWYVSLSPDGKTLASASEDGTIRCWDISTGKESRQFQGHNGSVWSVSFGPDGRLLASGGGSDGTVRIWDVNIGREVRHCPAHQGGVWPLAFSADGKTIVSAGWQDRTVRVWEVVTGRERCQFKSTSALKFSAVSPDCRTVACGSEDQAIRFWDLATGKERRRLEGHTGQVLSLAFSADGKLLASGSADSTIILWNMGIALKDDPLTAVDLASKDLEALWEELGRPDASKAHQAIWTLIGAGKAAVTFLQERLEPARVNTDGKRIEKLIEHLDDDHFAARERASGELEKIGLACESALRQVLGRNPSLEVRRRIERLLEKLEGGSMPPESLRAWRALEVLERIVTPESRRVLEKLAGGAPDATLTLDAKLGLLRLAKQANLH